MTQTYHQIRRHIDELQAQAEGVKRSEMAGVIAKVKDAIQVYGLTRQDLFDAKTYGATKGLKPAKSPKPARSATGTRGKIAEAKYADGKGGFWVGRGKRPHWLSDLLKAGAKLEDFLASKFSTAEPAAPVVEPATTPVAPEYSAPTPAPKKRASKKAAAKKVEAKKAPTKTGAKKAPKAKYVDGNGNAWSGRGPTPRWLKEAIASGKKLQDFVG